MIHTGEADICTGICKKSHARVTGFAEEVAIFVDILKIGGHYSYNTKPRDESGGGRAL